MSEQSVPPFGGNISFNAQHSPVGAFMSFTCGHFGTRGGFGLQIGQPGNQNLYIGAKDGDRYSDAPLKCLPFYQGATGNAADAFLGEQASGPVEQNATPKVVPYRADQIKRHYGWATDRWVTEDFQFTIYTPFFPIPNPIDASALQLSILPAVLADLVVDNTAGTVPRTVLFAVLFPDPGARLLDSSRGVFGFAWRRQIGVRAVPIDEQLGVHPFPFMRWTPDDGLMQSAPHGLGNCPGIGLTVPPGKRAGLRLVLGAYLDGIVTTGLEGRYLYTRAYGGLDTVLDVAHTRANHLLSQARLLDQQLLCSGLSSDQQFLIAHATRSYYGSTQLLDVGGQPFWVVNEGEYCMMNTLDLSIDHVFWELKQNPWVVRNVLDNFVRYYSYHDQVKASDEATKRRSDEETEGSQASPQLAGGISFCHDMGAHNNFSRFGHSSYELPDLTGCFSYMTAEQLCNWSLLAATYVLKTGDLDWAAHNSRILAACITSLANRGGDVGFMQFDSARCGSGAEITTYDSLDHSLAQTRNNVYMAVKCWASYVGLALVLERLGDSVAALARERAARIETELPRHVDSDGVLPAVFEKDSPGYGSRILPAIEGLMYPLAWGAEIPASLKQLLGGHALALLLHPQRRNLFADGGIKLSSTSNNSWMSKIALFQHVARQVLGLENDPRIKELFARADAAHVKWQTDGSGYWACSDQFVSGVAKGSRYYPRIITAALWMKDDR